MFNDRSSEEEFFHHVERHLSIRGTKKYTRGNEESPFFELNDSQFLARFRFTKEIVQHTILPLCSTPEAVTQRGLPLSNLAQILIALRFYATGSMQIVCGDLRSVSQATVSRIVANVSKRIAMHCKQYIKFPREIEHVRNHFYQIGGFPGVTGVIDCTHIPIKSPGGESAESFRNRKGWMSLNVQVVCGPKLEIMDIVIRWPGSAHDSRIFDNSSVMVAFEEGRLGGILLGDGGYAQRKYLFTPIPNPNNAAEQRYNRAHVRTRNAVERCFGVWKRRFSCLSKKLNNKLTTTCHIIAACAILHNIAIDGNCALDENIALENTEVPVVSIQDRGPGHAIRQAFIERHFS